MKTTFLKADKTKYEPGDAIFWRGLHGVPMAGTVARVMYDSYDVTRVDGGLCSVPFSYPGLKHATLDEWDDAIKVFTKGHENDWKKEWPESQIRRVRTNVPDASTMGIEK